MAGLELFEGGDEEGFERVHSLPGQGGDLENVKTRVDLQGLASGPIRVERQMGDEVDLGQDEDVGGEECFRVLLRLVVPFGR